MNLILFEPSELNTPLPRQDPRSIHLLRVLRRAEGDQFDAGVVDGQRGKGTITGIEEERLSFSFSFSGAIPERPPVTLLTGLPRPQTARKILQEATALGVSAIHFFSSERGEPSYASSKLWSSGEYRRHLIAGAEQAFCTRLPDLQLHPDLSSFLAGPGLPDKRVALDNYEADGSLGQHLITSPAVALAVGPERGWSEKERIRLKEAGFALVDLGKRVLRTETACVSGITLVLAKMGWL